MRPALPALTFLAALAACTTPPPVPVTGAVDGAWSNPATWGGTLPGANSAVTIPAGKTVTVDSSLAVRSLTVNGTLQWADVDGVELKSNWIMVERGGAFKMGTQTAPFTKRATITLTGSDVNENIMGMGTKFLGAMDGGALEIWGAPKVSWTQLNASAAKGATTLTLERDVDWRAGDQVVIASSSMDANEAELRTVSSVTGKTVTLDRPLQYAHFGVLQTIEGNTVDERAEVGLLSRNIVIQGDDASTLNRFGGHVMVMQGSSAKIQGVELRRMGQFDRLGRYPMHFHLMREASGSFINNSSVHNSFQRGIVVHGSDNVRVERNVVYGTPGHAYVLEDGSERGAVFDGNLGLLSKAVTFTAQGLKDPNDAGAATFWLRTAAGTITNNHSAGGAHAGFWFDMGSVDGNDATKALLTFKDNTVHSHDDQRLPNSESDPWAVWHTDGFVPSSEGILKLEGVTAYKNARAIETLGRGIVSNAVLSGNGKAISGVTLRNSLVVSRSANTDSDPDWGQTGMFAYGGFAVAQNVTWVGFKEGRTVSSTLACGIEYPRFTNASARLVNSDLSAGCGDVIQSDLDGKLSGASGARQLVKYPNEFGLVTAQCQTNGGLGVAVCPDYDYRTLGVTYPSGPNDRFSNDNWRVDVVRDEDGDRVTPDHFRWVSYTVPGKSYRLEVRSRKNAGDTSVYNLSKLEYLNLGYSAGERADPAPLEGTRALPFDPAAATRSLEVSAAAYDTGFRVRVCRAGQTCDNDPGKWALLGASSSLSALRSGSSTGYVVDSGRLVLRFFGGDRLRLERQ
jgi:hypothetical protein